LLSTDVKLKQRNWLISPQGQYWMGAQYSVIKTASHSIICWFTSILSILSQTQFPHSIAIMSPGMRWLLVLGRSILNFGNSAPLLPADLRRQQWCTADGKFSLVVSLHHSCLHIPFLQLVQLTSYQSFSEWFLPIRDFIALPEGSILSPLRNWDEIEWTIFINYFFLINI
jgi:hypothetical protein